MRGPDSPDWLVKTKHWADGGKTLMRRRKFLLLSCRNSCQEVKVKANPAVRGPRIKVFEIWIRQLSNSQYQGLSIISVDRLINTSTRTFSPLLRRFFLAGLLWCLLHMPLMTTWLFFRQWHFSSTSSWRAAYVASHSSRYDELFFFLFHHGTLVEE